MGQNQSIDSTNPHKSKDQLLYHLVNTGNVDAIQSLRSEAVNLEWIDKEGKTPLIVASMDSGLINVAKTLIEIGANVNAYRPGRHAGTPLHHAAKRGLEQTVLLLLSNGANALVRNDDCHTALDVARIKGHTTVVRAIENHIGYFTGWLQELHGPSFLEALAPQLLSKKIWVVVIPCGSSNPMKPVKLELAIYPTLEDSQPRSVIALWKAKLEEPKFQRSDPGFTIVDNSTKTRYKFASSNEGDKEQLRRFYDACRGISQVKPPTANHNAQTTLPDIRHQQSAEALELAMAISASIQSVAEERPPTLNTGWENSANDESHNGWGPPVAPTLTEPSSSRLMVHEQKTDHNGWSVHNSRPTGNQASAPSAPPIPEELALDEGPISYPSIEGVANSSDDGGASSSCVICWEAPVEGACIPCGHMAGCMTCLKEIERKKGVCPVCRAKMKQVIRIYTV